MDHQKIYRRGLVKQEDGVLGKSSKLFILLT